MKTIVLSILLILVIILVPVSNAGDPAGRTEFLNYLPHTTIGGFRPMGPAQYAKGEDLYLLINGGAEIYIEYGFKQALVQEFKSRSKKGFNLEVYEMEDAEAAYGIYTYKTGENGKELNIGNEGLLEEYYLNFWKGNFLVTVIGFDSDKETLDGIIQAAEAVSAKIKAGGKKPELLNMLPEANESKLKQNGITYLKGNLALYGKYEFDAADIFGLKEGVIADYGDYKLFIFKYADEKECKQWFLNAVKKLQANKRFKNFQSEEDGLRMINEKGIPVYLKHKKHYIFIEVGAAELSED